MKRKDTLNALMYLMIFLCYFRVDISDYLLIRTKITGLYIQIWLNYIDNLYSKWGKV